MPPTQTKGEPLLFVRIITYTIVVVAVGILAVALYPWYLANQIKTATIIFSAPLSLESTTVSENSALLALEEHNYQAGDITLYFTTYDDGDPSGGWDETKEAANAKRAAEDSTVVAYLGPLNSGAAKVSMPILNAAGILQISPSNTWPGLTKPGFLTGEPSIFYPNGTRHYFRTATTDDLQGPAGARWAEKLGYDRVYVVDDGDSYGVGIARLFERGLRDRGITVVKHESVSADKEVYERIANDILSSHANLVYYGGITPNGGPELLKTLRDKGSQVAFMGPDGIFEQDFLDRAGHHASEGLMLTAIGIPPESVDTPKAKDFVMRYTKRFGGAPDVFGALTYDAMNAVIESIEQAGRVNRRDILNAMKDIQKHEGVFGPYSFTNEGDTSLHLISANVVRDGEFVYEETLDTVHE